MTVWASRVFVIGMAALAALAGGPARAGVSIDYSGAASPGTIVVQTSDRTVLFVVGDGKAIQYTAGVGRAGKQWFGTTRIVSKHIRPAWAPPRGMRGNRPDWVIPAGSPRNPMGAAALVLADNELAIHGTNNPGSIGNFVSWGCVRLQNEEILDLYKRVSVGTPVIFAR
jgi:lipoprotein-anchoring transpeptidase ErfK/SrfK